MLTTKSILVTGITEYRDGNPVKTLVVEVEKRVNEFLSKLEEGMEYVDMKIDTHITTGASNDHAFITFILKKDGVKEEKSFFGRKNK